MCFVVYIVNTPVGMWDIWYATHKLLIQVGHLYVKWHLDAKMGLTPSDSVLHYTYLNASFEPATYMFL